MKFIDKDNAENKNKGEQWSRKAMETIADIPNEQNNAIISWDILGKKKELKQILSEEQEHLCCYCMRKLQPNNTTIEHIIPRNISSNEELTKYQTHRFLDPSRVSVLINETIGTYKQLKYPPFPHLIAYENLTVSCNGQLDNRSVKCCNNKRGNKYIEPLFFIHEITKIIKYDFEGKIDLDEEYESTVKNVGLNYRPLCEIRKMWYEIVEKTGYNIDDIERAKADSNLRNDIIDDIEDTEFKYSTFRKSNWWAVFADYSWFYEYYSQRRCHSNNEKF